MGADPLAAVRPDLVLHGMSGLRVVDASVMPSMPSANTYSSTMMIAEKAADLILASRKARAVGTGAGEGERVNEVPSSDGRY